MFHRLLKAYKEEGYEIHIGNTLCMCAILTHNGSFAYTGGGISLTDVAWFFGLASIHKPRRILCVGNAAGYGTLCLAEIFDCPIDVIDAEIEGAFNAEGSRLTRRFSHLYYEDRITLVKGFSPQDLGVFADHRYDLIFLDGLHTDRQQLLDVAGIMALAAESCVIYLHDVEMLGMQTSWNHIRHNTDGFTGYDVDFTNFGCKALVRDLPIVEEWLQMTARSPMAEFHNPPATLRAAAIVHPVEPAQFGDPVL